MRGDYSTPAESPNLNSCNPLPNREKKIHTTANNTSKKKIRTINYSIFKNHLLFLKRKIIYRFALKKSFNGFLSTIFLFGYLYVFFFPQINDIHDRVLQ